MQLVWYGHSCFMLKTNEGKRILMDPFNDSLGYKINYPKCDLITTSHSHFDHSFINITNDQTKTIHTSGLFNFDFLQLKGLKSFHDNFNGLKRGINIIYILKIGNISIGHLGDLGCIPPSPIINELCNLDILLIPIGGHFTLDGNEAAKLCKTLLPKYIIPMHYKTNPTRLYIDDCKNFIISMNNIQKIDSNIIDFSDLDFSTNINMQTLLLKPPY